MLQSMRVTLISGRRLSLNRVIHSQLSLTFSLPMYHRFQPGPKVLSCPHFIVNTILISPLGDGPVATAAVNPWADNCPVPYHFWVNSFYSNATFASLTVSYNGGTFLCPNAPANEIMYNGVYDMYCDDDGLVRVITDGQSWITISEWSWCLPIPRYVPQDPKSDVYISLTHISQTSSKSPHVGGRLQLHQFRHCA
jgi:hypothetical protein